MMHTTYVTFIQNILYSIRSIYEVLQTVTFYNFNALIPNSLFPSSIITIKGDSIHWTSRNILFQEK